MSLVKSDTGVSSGRGVPAVVGPLAGVLLIDGTTDILKPVVWELAADGRELG